MRCFVALWPSKEVQDYLGLLLRPAHRGVRWTRVDQWHVTLAFLGEVAPSQVTELRAALVAPAASAGRLRALVGPETEILGRSVLCVGVTGLDRLAAAVRASLEASGFSLEDRPFRGHLTLARARGPVPLELVGTPLAASWVPEELALVVSERGVDGARYQTVARVALGPRG